jgi:hypothetical protein
MASRAAHPAEAMLMPVPQASDNPWRQPPAQPVQMASAQEPPSRRQAVETADYERPVGQWPASRATAVRQAVYDAPTTAGSPGAKQVDPQHGEVRPAAAQWELSAPRDQLLPLPPPRSSTAVRIGLSDGAATTPTAIQPAASGAARGPVRVSLNDAP